MTKRKKPRAAENAAYMDFVLDMTLRGLKNPLRPPGRETPSAIADLEWLEEHAGLWFRWSQVPTRFFFSEITIPLLAHLEENGLVFLPAFLEQSANDAREAIQSLDVNMPLALRKLHERYHTSIMG